jgi:WD40 repeat protein
MLKGHTGEIFGAAFSPDGKRLASASSDKTVKVWDVQTGQQTLTIKGHTVPVWSVAFSPDGKRLASGSGTEGVGPAHRNPAELKVWDVQTGQELLTLLKGVTGMVSSVAFSPDGKRLAGTHSEVQRPGQERPLQSIMPTVKVWDAQTGQELLSLKGASGMAFSPDGKRLVSISRGELGPRGGGPAPGEVKVWDAQTGKELFTFNPGGVITNVAFSPDGKRLVSISRVRGQGPATDNLNVEVKVWDAQTGQELRTLQGGGRVPSGGAGGRGLGLALSPDGRRLASAHGETLKVWDTQTGEELLTLKVHTGGVHKVSFSPDGHRLAGGGWDGTVWIWDATPLPQK